MKIYVYLRCALLIKTNNNSYSAWSVNFVQKSSDVSAIKRPLVNTSTYLHCIIHFWDLIERPFPRAALKIKLSNISIT